MSIAEARRHCCMRLMERYHTTDFDLIAQVEMMVRQRHKYRDQVKLVTGKDRHRRTVWRVTLEGTTYCVVYSCSDGIVTFLPPDAIGLQRRRDG